MNLILDEKETEAYLSLKKRAKILYKQYNNLVEKIQNINHEVGDSNFFEINILKNRLLPYYYEDLESKITSQEDVDKWVISEKGCVITCPECGKRLELCYPDGTEVRYLPFCPYCGKELVI